MSEINWNIVEYEASSGTHTQLIHPDKPEIVFSGKSNVGKSSLINTLLNRKNLAYTSSTPGKTVTINFYNMQDLRLVDLPGYGYAKVAKSEKERWSSLVEGYFNDKRDLRLVIQLIDVRHKPSADDYQMLNYMVDWGIPFVVALTKVDKLKKNARIKRLKEIEQELEEFSGLKLIPFSSVTREGREELREIIQYVTSEDNTLGG